MTKWALQFNVHHTSLNALLKGLKKHKCFKDFPMNSRTLLSIPINISKDIETVEPGMYYHFGLAASIIKYIPKNVNEVNIAIGINGVPLSKSSGSQFWPILG